MRPVALPPATGPRARAPYENWRPPITGVSVLALVGATSLVVPHLPSGTWALPTGSVEGEQSPEEAAQAVLTPLYGPLPIHRRVLVDRVQMRRRAVITHLVVTKPLTAYEAYTFSYRDPRAELRIVRTEQALASLPERARLRALVGLQTLAIGATAHLRDGEVQQLEAASAA
ncbi:hypothetical protein [Streptomyces sp. NPDC088789]|uniref:hypothetical protein n=1 Tax=Streptomyces sp. NPDC088789 TaxID=3365899 RepID=UPI0037FA4123